MAIPKAAIIIVGCLTLVLFIVILGYLIYKGWGVWTNRKRRCKYHVIAEKYPAKPSSSRRTSPKFSITFPTMPVFLQLASKESSYHDLHKQKKNEAELEDENHSQWQHRRNRRVHSESDITMLQSPVGGDRRHETARRAKSEVEVRARPRKVTSQSALRVVSEVSGELEYTTLFHSAKNMLEVNIIQVIDVSEIMPELFSDRCEVVGADMVAPSGQPYLVRHENGTLTFSDLSQLGMAVEVMRYPRKEHVGTTDYKFGLQNPTFDESFMVVCQTSQQFSKTLLRLQVLLRYGRHPQMPVILGESVLALRHCQQDSLNTFRCHLKHPMNEKDLESSLEEQTETGQLTVSVRYQLLRSILSVRIVDASFTKLAIQQPNISFKIGVYFAGQQVYRQVTDVIKRRANPQISRSFDFGVPLENLSETGLLIEVRSHSAVQRNSVGYVHIASAARKPACDYWKKVIAFAEFNSECILDIVADKPTKIC